MESGGSPHEGKIQQTTVPAATVIVRDFKCTQDGDSLLHPSGNLRHSRITASASLFSNTNIAATKPQRPARTSLITYNEATDSRFDSQPFAFSFSPVTRCKKIAYVLNLTFARYAHDGVFCLMFCFSYILSLFLCLSSQSLPLMQLCRNHNLSDSCNEVAGVSVASPSSTTFLNYAAIFTPLC